MDDPLLAGRVVLERDNEPSQISRTDALGHDMVALTARPIPVEPLPHISHMQYLHSFSSIAPHILGFAARGAPYMALPFVPKLALVVPNLALVARSPKCLLNVYVDILLVPDLALPMPGPLPGTRFRAPKRTAPCSHAEYEARHSRVWGCCLSLDGQHARTDRRIVRLNA